jgi:hypothetical protein
MRASVLEHIAAFMDVPSEDSSVMSSVRCSGSSMTSGKIVRKSRREQGRSKPADEKPQALSF